MGTGRKLKLTIVEGKDLIAKSGKYDTYVKLRYGKVSSVSFRRYFFPSQLEQVRFCTFYILVELLPYFEIIDDFCSL